MREITYLEAIREALAEEMRRDPKVFVLGEDVCFELDLAASRRAGAVRDRFAGGGGQSLRLPA